MQAETQFLPSFQEIKTVKLSYEPGMKVTYDAVSKRVIVAFRGRITVLPDMYDSEAQGSAAGEIYCRNLGWNPREQVGSGKKQLRWIF